MTDTNRYGPTAARKQDRPGREIRPKSLTLDIHSHVAVPAAAAIAGPHLDLSRVPLAHFATDNVKALNAKQEADRRSRISGIEIASREGPWSGRGHVGLLVSVILADASKSCSQSVRVLEGALLKPEGWLSLLPGEVMPTATGDGPGRVSWTSPWPVAPGDLRSIQLSRDRSTTLRFQCH